MTAGEQFLATVNAIPDAASKEERIRIYFEAQDEFNKQWEERCKEVANKKKTLHNPCVVATGRLLR